MKIEQVYGWSGTPVGPPSVSIGRSADRTDKRIGFRLTCTRVAFQETRGRCWQSRTQYPEWQLDRQDETAENVGFRLTKDSI
jgi:hypothetical protein